MAKWLLVLLTFSSTATWSQVLPSDSVTENRAESSETDKQIQTLQDRVKRSPADYAGFDGLGAAFLQKARETGDISYYNLAEQALKKALALVPQDFRAADPSIHMAVVCMGEHRFADALSFAQRAIATGSGSLAAFAIEGDAYTDMGDYDQAQLAYDTVQALGRLSTPPLMLAYMSDSRQAYLRFLHGESAAAVGLMKDSIAAGLQANIPRENLAWLYFELGERYFQSGALEEASLSYESGIAADPNHYRSLAGLAKVRAAQGRFEESIQLYQRSIAIIPFPVYVAELGDVYRRVGKPEEAQRQYELVEYIGHLSELNRVLANRELALFYADQEIKLAEALKLARNELEVRRDIYTWDALAWALYKNGRFAEAGQATEKALSLHTNDPQLLFHAGMIYHSLAKDAEATDLLNRALQINPHFHVLDAEVAAHALAEINRPLSAVSRSAHVQR